MIPNVDSQQIHHDDRKLLSADKLKTTCALIKKGCKIKKIEKTTGLHPKTIIHIKSQI